MTALADPFADWRPTVNLSTDPHYARLIEQLRDRDHRSDRPVRAGEPPAPAAGEVGGPASPAPPRLFEGEID